ncbi:hypothetical protein EON64_04235 [archaeon]|nr:MAG: hypothetical protein EON64_04235 [archaeon]
MLPVPEPESAGDGNPIEGPDSSANARDSDDDNEEDVENKDFGSAEEMEARFAEDQGHTLFVGNVALTAATTKVLKRIFSPFGEIQSIRIRSLPIAGTKVDEAGNQNLVKKVCAQKLILGTQKGSANAYIKFAEQGSIAKAMKEIDNTVVEGRHLRVDKLPPSLLDNQTTVFVGNLPRLADEEELRDFFAQVSLAILLPR